MKLYRYSTRRWIDVLDGQGAAQYGGRFNAKGTPALYCCMNPSLPYLECLAANFSRAVWPEYVIAEIDFIDDGVDIKWIDLVDMPADWDDLARADHVQEWGSRQLRDSDVVILPSRVNPLDRTVVLNPTRPGFSERISVRAIDFLQLDSRLEEWVLSNT